MDRAALQDLQGPLERYLDEPAAARVTLSAKADLGAGVSCSVATGRGLAEADADSEQIANLLRLTERYCVVPQTITGAPRVNVVLAE